MIAPLLAAHLFLGAPIAAEPSAPPSPTVVVELFTSQGCSSCPPADELLRRLGREEGVVALSFHVDYWDRLGWKDPFSDHRWTERQEAYARAFRTNRSYTPMMVIDGLRDLVGSRELDVRSAIAERRSTPSRAEVHVDARLEDGRVRADVRVDAWKELPKKTDVVLLVWETGHRTKVPRGENARRTLLNDYVVREMLVEPMREGELSFDVALESDWSASELGVAVLVQARSTRAVLAARSLVLLGEG